MADNEEIARWVAFAARVKLTFPFQADVVVEPSERHEDRIQMAVVLHVLERDTREPITVKTRRHCGPWTCDSNAVELLFDLLDIAFRHEIHESVRLDGHLVRGLHVA